MLNEEDDRKNVSPYPHDDVTLSWVKSFLAKHPEVKLANPRKMESSRIKFATRENFERYFATVTGLFEANDYHPSMVANFDETMLQWGKSRAKVIVGAQTKQAFVEEPELSMHVTLCVTIFADGTPEKALVILPLKNLPPDIVENDYPNFNWTGQKNG